MFVQFGLGNAQAAEDVGDPVRAEDAAGGHARVLRFESDGQAHISDEDEARDVPSISIALAKKSEGQVLHSYIRLLDRSIFIEKTSTMHLRYSFYIFTDFSDQYFLHPHLSIATNFLHGAKSMEHSVNLYHKA